MRAKLTSKTCWEFMTQLGPEIANDVLAACQQGVGDAAIALGELLEQEVAVEVGESSPLDREALPKDFGGAGLLTLFRLGDVAAVVLIPQSSGVLPDWYGQPDAAGEIKLTVLSSKLAKSLLPSDLTTDLAVAHRESFLGEALGRGKVADDATVISFQLKIGDVSAPMLLVWPLNDPAAIRTEIAETEATPAPPAASAAPVEPAPPVEPPPAPAPIQPPVQAAPPKPVRSEPARLEAFPSYGRSLLHIEVPVTASLAATLQSIDDVMQIAPGTIIQFEKSCEELLELEIGGTRIALGEAVKVGDKFGLRIKEITLPEERFTSVHG